MAKNTTKLITELNKALGALSDEPSPIEKPKGLALADRDKNAQQAFKHIENCGKIAIEILSDLEMLLHAAHCDVINISKMFKKL